MNTASAKKRQAKSDAAVLRHVEDIICAALEIMDELPYESEGHAHAEQIRELAGKLESYVHGE